MGRKATVGAVALAVLVMVAAAIGALIVKDWLHDTDVLMFGGGPTSAKLIDERVGKVDPGSLGLSGDVLLRSKGDGGLYVQDLDAADRPAVKLFDALVVRGVSPDGRHVVAWRSGGHYRIVRLSDLRAVGEIRGGTSVFLDPNRVLVVFEGEQCTRRDAVILDLQQRTVSRLPLSGPRERFLPVGVVEGDVVGQRQGLGDSGCRDTGAAMLDLDDGRVKTVTTEGTVSAVASRHVWVDDVIQAKERQTRVLGPDGTVVASGPPLLAEAVGSDVVYAQEPAHVALGEPPSGESTILRVAPGGVPRADDRFGAEVVDLQSLTATVDGKAVLAVQRGFDRREGERSAAVHLCSVPDLKCRRLADISGDLPKTTNVVSAGVFGAG
ncbi:MAG TPA: hypothetical protein VHF27_08640 [Acidimicrobiales bacterium]|nr:hypothetical protein [Acidimicrobiales bacterium]